MKPSQILPALDFLLKSDKPAMLWGPPGVGKSDMVRTVGKAAKLPVIDIRLNLYDPTEFKGFPVVQDGVMRFLPPALLPRSGKGILFLDELCSAPPSMANMAYQLVLDRRVGEYELPKGWRIVAASNRAGDKGVHYAMPPALANRFVHVDVVADAKDWDNWAKDKGVGVLTRAYLRSQPHKLHCMDTSKEALGMAFPSPRSWVVADGIQTDQTLSAELKHELLAGTIGPGFAMEYLAFINHAEELPTIDEIIKNPDGAALPTKPGSRFAVVTMLAAKVDKANVAAFVAYLERVTPEFQARFMSEVLTADTSFATSPAVSRWLTKNHTLLSQVA